MSTGEYYYGPKDIPQKDILQQYVEDAVKTASRISAVEVHERLYSNAKTVFIQISEILDQIKKNVFYGKAYNAEKLAANLEQINDAQENLREAITHLSATPKTTLKINPDVFHGILGIATESGELLELARSTVEPNKIFDEMGDINWYTALLLDALKGDWATIQRANIAKLKARYPEKFDADRAINRDVVNEKVVLDDVLNRNTTAILD